MHFLLMLQEKKQQKKKPSVRGSEQGEMKTKQAKHLLAHYPPHGTLLRQCSSFKKKRKTGISIQHNVESLNSCQVVFTPEGAWLSFCKA